jgi:hypothetical protein
MIADLAARLFDEDAAIPPAWIRDSDSVSWHRPGLVSAWVDDLGQSDLEQRLGCPLDGNLLTWWTASAQQEHAGAADCSLWGQADRLLDQHATSILRIQLTAVLRMGFHHSPRLVDWVAQRLLVVAVPTSVSVDLVEVDRALHPPVAALLRARGAATPAQQRVVELRQDRRARWAAMRERMAARRRDTGGPPTAMLPGLVSTTGEQAWRRGCTRPRRSSPRRRRSCS